MPKPKQKQKVVIPLKSPSLNEMFGRKHWRDRQKLNNIWKMEVLVAVRQAKLPPFTKFPLKLASTAYFKKKRSRDTDNTIVAVKLFLDGLRAVGTIPDDSTEYISEITLKAPVVDGTDRVEFEISEAKS